MTHGIASVLIVTYNSSSTIVDCLLSLNDQSFKNFEVLLLDNDSEDETKAIIDALQPRLGFPFRQFYLDHNIGFAGGNNFLFRQATGPYIALLNPDAVADAQWLEVLVAVQERDSTVGICASKLLSRDGKYIDSAGDGFSGLLKSFKRGEGRLPTSYVETESVFGACAGAALYRRSMLEEIGFFDEDFFLIHEDGDMNCRAQLMGWQAIFVPDAVVYHQIHGSIGKMTDVQVYYNVRNLEFVRIKNVPLSMILKHIPEVLIGAVMEFIYFAVLHKKLRMYLLAKRDVARTFSLMYGKRKVLLRNAKHRKARMEKLLTPVWDAQFMRAKLKRFLLMHR